MINRFDLEGRTIIVTGGLGQLGHAFTTGLADQGARVGVLDLTDDPAAIRARYGDRAGDPKLLFVAADVTDRASLEAALARVTEHWGAVPQGLVNNAGIDTTPDAPPEVSGPFENFPEAVFDRVMSVNTKGVVLCCQVIGGAMAKAGRGSIVNVGSIYGVVSPDQGLYEDRRQNGEVFFKPAAYSVSKSALYNLTRYLATYWAPKGVRTNIVTFAGVFNDQNAGFRARYTAKVPLGRMADADEYTGGVIFLLSDASSYMTGANLVMDGGFTAW
jgi:NAD(P)-dependent dehydrogenase (short-subunit alcohol dehydrogenase family)